MANLTARPTPERITLLLATYNGAAHLQQQLDSYIAQSDQGWDLWISDDGSTDGTRAIIAAFRNRHGNDHDIRLIEGPRQGFAANFMSLLTHPDLPAGPVALSDQDDVWMAQRLSRARVALAPYDTNPAIYGAQTIYVDENLREIGCSRMPPRPPSFANALTQNIVSGNTVVLNTAGLALVRKAGPPAGIPYHDWWLYQVMSGAGGSVIIDNSPVLKYRQHGTNAMGAHQGALSSLRRSAQVMRRTYGTWIETNIAALAQITPVLTPQNRHLIETLRGLPMRGGPARARALYRLGLRRQTPQATAALIIAAFFGRI